MTFSGECAMMVLSQILSPERSIPTKHLLRSFALILMLAIMLTSFAGCVVDPNRTPPETEPETDPLPPAEIVPILERYPYTLTQADYDTFVTLMDECRALLLPDGNDTAAIEAKLEEMIEQYYHIETQVMMVRVKTDVDTKDQALSDEYLFAFEMLTDVFDLYQQLCKDVDDSTSAYRDTFFADWTEEELEEMRNYTPEQMEIENKIQELEAEYRMFDDEQLLANTGEIYLQLIDLNNQMAQLNGYENYVDYAYAEVYDRDYAPEDTEIMRKYVKEHLVPLLGILYSDFQDSLNRLSPNNRNHLVNLLYSDYDVVAYAAFEAYLDFLPDELGDAMMDAIKSKNAVFSDDEEKANAGAYANYLNEKEHPICYFGPGYQDTLTVLHELGHYCAMYLNKGSDGSMDIAETHSQGNEYLFLAYIHNNRNSASYSTLLKYRLFEDVLTVIMSTIVDEFEQYVYTHDVEDPAEFDEIMNRIRDSYVSKETLDSYGIIDLNEYWKRVAIEQECYYISYGVSALAAIQLYGMGVENFDQAIESYSAIVHAPTEELGFMAALEKAGLMSPFEESLYEFLPSLRSKS